MEGQRVSGVAGKRGSGTRRFRGVVSSKQRAAGGGHLAAGNGGRHGGSGSGGRAGRAALGADGRAPRLVAGEPVVGEGGRVDGGGVGHAARGAGGRVHHHARRAEVAGEGRGVVGGGVESPRTGAGGRGPAVRGGHRGWVGVVDGGAEGGGGGGGVEGDLGMVVLDHVVAGYTVVCTTPAERGGAEFNVVRLPKGEEPSSTWFACRKGRSRVYGRTSGSSGSTTGGGPTGSGNTSGRREEKNRTSGSSGSTTGGGPTGSVNTSGRREERNRTSGSSGSTTGGGPTGSGNTSDSEEWSGEWGQGQAVRRGHWRANRKRESKSRMISGKRGEFSRKAREPCVERSFQPVCCWGEIVIARIICVCRLGAVVNQDITSSLACKPHALLRRRVAARPPAPGVTPLRPTSGHGDVAQGCLYPLGLSPYICHVFSGGLWL